MIWNRKKPYLAEITSSKLLSGKYSNKEIMHYEISLGDSGIYYEPGDSLAVIPTNDHNLVLAIIDRLGMNSAIIPDGQNSSLFELLISHYEILTPTNRLIYFINENIKHHDLNMAVKSDDKNLLNEFKYGKDVLDFINLDKNFKIDLNIFLTLLKQLQHRAYSITSSHNAYPKKIHLTVSTQRWKNNFRNYNGVCSTFLADKCFKGTKIKIFLIPNRIFKLPKNQEKAVIMIGPGTGLAPFISFLQERKFLRSSGKNWLFFGAQTRINDFIYKNEILNFKKNKVLQKLDLAFSRDQSKKIYVQDKMYESRAEIFQWLEDGAILYVCGDALKMAKDVDNMLKRIIKDQLDCNEIKSLEYIKNLKKEKRYLLDVY